MTTTASHPVAGPAAGSRSPAPWRRAALAVGLLLGLLAAPPRLLAAPADEPPDSPAALVGAVSAALRGEDAPALIALVDFAAHCAEGRLRGTVIEDWQRLDEPARERYRQELAQAWLGDDPGFLRLGRVYDFLPLEDPDAGHGPVPDRFLMKVVLKASARGQHREMLLIGTPEHRLVHLEFGPPFAPGSNPLGPEGLQPRSFREDLQERFRWPEELDDFEREAAQELVGELLRSDPGYERERWIEYLHRSPRAGVAALLERLLRLAEDDPGDGTAARLLVSVMERLTGRHGGLPPEDETLPPDQLQAEARAWLAWHGVHGASFEPTPVMAPIEPTFEERDLDDFPPRGWRDPTVEEDAAPAADQDPPDVAPVPARPPAPPVPVTDGPTGSGSAGSPTDTDHDPDTLTLDDSPDRQRPTVRFRRPEPVALEPEAPDGLSGFQVLLVPPGARSGESLPVDQALDQLPGPVRARLELLGGLFAELDLRVAFGGDDDLLVAGLGGDRQLIDALTVLRRARDELGPLVPRTGTGAEHPVLAILADDTLLRGWQWAALLDGLSARRLLDADVAQRLQRDPGGATNRTAGWFLQPTMDLAGDASAGDDEFRLDNELAHKLLGCLAVQRCGFLPRGLLWALGHLAEQRLFGTTYQFNKSGFVATGDHFDWPRQARSALEKASRSRAFDLGQTVLEAGEPAERLDGQLIAWATVEYLASRRPADLDALFRDLAELHAEARPYGGARDYEGDRQATLQALALRLGQEPVDGILAHLDQLD